MTTHRVVTTDTQIDQAISRAKALTKEPRVTGVAYRPGPGLDLLILQMSDGHRCALPREDLQGLQGATRQQISQIEILGNGTGLHWPALDVDLYVPALLQGIYGTRRWMAEIGAKGGAATSSAKRKASRANGRQGGRPKRQESSAIAA
jgi:hypothetical protein